MIRALLLLLAAFGALIAAPAQSQTATAEWSSLGVAANTPATSPGTITASDGTSVAIAYSASINGAALSTIHFSAPRQALAGSPGSPVRPIVSPVNSTEWPP